MNDVTQIVSQSEAGDSSAADQLLPLVYDERRMLATQHLRRESPGLTLQAMALVHEAYVRLIESDLSQPWNGRRHFFASATQAMRRILVDRARQKLSLKGGGGKVRRDVEADKFAEIVALPEVVAAHDLLDALAAEGALVRRTSEAPLLRRMFHGRDGGDTAAIAHNHLSIVDICSRLAAGVA